MPKLQELLYETLRDLATFNYVVNVGGRRLSTQFVKWFDPEQKISTILYHAPRGIYIGFTEQFINIVITFDHRVLNEPVLINGEEVHSCEIDFLNMMIKVNVKEGDKIKTIELRPEEEFLKIGETSITVANFVMEFGRVLLATLKEVLMLLNNITTGLEIRFLKM